MPHPPQRLKTLPPSLCRWGVRLALSSRPLPTAAARNRTKRESALTRELHRQQGPGHGARHLPVWTFRPPLGGNGPPATSGRPAIVVSDPCSNLTSRVKCEL